MKLSEKLRVNTPNVVHETIDGEAILLDLNTGNYFSLDGSGAVIWDFIDKYGLWSKAIEIMKSANTESENLISDSVTAFVQELFDERLVVAMLDGVDDAIAPEIEEQLKTTACNFTPPKVNKYSDMQDLLLLDPIHEVDEKGWPESSEIREEMKTEE